MYAMNPNLEHSLATGAVDPAAILAKLYEETTALLDANTDDLGDMLSNRMRGIEDVICSLPTSDPAALRVQAKAIRGYTKDFNHDGHTSAIMTLCAAYAERLAKPATIDKPVAAPPVRSLPTVALCDASAHLLDALGAVDMAIDGVNEQHQVRSLRFLVETVQDIAQEVDDIAGRLHAGIPSDGNDGVNPDAGLLDLITAWRVTNDRVVETDSAPEHVARSHKLLRKIADTKAITFRGALAKARIQFDDDEIAREIADGAPMEVVGAAALRDLFRMTEGA
jgi:hypothetical protein